MGQKTSQLQIRVSLEQKELLKRLAHAAGMSVSAYVLDAALPRRGTQLREHLTALKEGEDRRSTVTALRQALSEIPPEHFAAATDGLDVYELSPVLQNVVAASVEHEAQLRGAPPPGWAASVSPLRRPTFGPDLGSLRPYLMCSAPPALKRRNVFMSWGETDAPPAPRTTPSTGTHRAEPEPRLVRLGAILEGRRVSVELCVVGGAVMPFVFHAVPETRRPRALFAAERTLTDAAGEAAPELDGSWLDEATRRVVRDAGSAGHVPLYTTGGLAVFEPPAEYVLAMKCLALAWAPAPMPSAERDISYLLRFLGLSQPRRALERITTYLNSRQMPRDLELRLPHLV